MTLSSHEAKFKQAIDAYQYSGETLLLKDWVEKQGVLEDAQHIQDLAALVFCIEYNRFQPGTAGALADILSHCQFTGSLNHIGKAQVCSAVWLEEAQEFKKLFNTYDKVFWQGNSDIQGNKRLTTVAEHFVATSLKKPKGFWKTIFEFNTNINFYDENSTDIIENIQAWLDKVAPASEFVRPFCPALKDSQQVKVAHVAYACLHHGQRIHHDILKVSQDRRLEVLAPVFNSMGLKLQIESALAAQDKTLNWCQQGPPRKHKL